MMCLRVGETRIKVAEKDLRGSIIEFFTSPVCYRMREWI
jgi:hypothetical protein